MIQCSYCGKQVYISHICPFCGEHYCLEHRAPQIHNCSHSKELQTRRREVGPSTFRTAKPTRQVNRAHERAITSMTYENTKTLDLNSTRLEAKSPQIFAEKILYRQKSFNATLERIARSLFAISFVLVLSDEILRLISYLTHPPLLAYLDGNIFVRLLIDFTVSPLIASLLAFAALCFTLFLTRKLTSWNKKTDQAHAKLHPKVLSIIVFITIASINTLAIIEWILILV